MPIIELNSNERSYCPFMISLDRYNGSCNTLDDPPSRNCVLNKTKVVNLNHFVKRIKKKQQNIFYVIVNVNLMARNVV